MAIKNPLNGAPYYDDYDPSKNYVGLAIVPGRIAQAREGTQAQTILRDFLGRLGDALLADGTVITGCSVVINDRTVTLTEGTLYLEGLVRYTNSTTLTITGKGFERICAKVIQTIVTENEDSSLRDPVQNYQNSGQAGAHRIKEQVVFSVVQENESPAGVVIYTLSNGELVKTEAQSDTNAYLTETLARRSYDENGSFKVEGLELRDRNESNEDGILISVSEGKAYIKGYEVTKQTSSTVLVDFCTDTKSVKYEPHQYIENLNELSGKDPLKFELNNVPVKKINRVMAEILVERFPVTRNAVSVSGYLDSLGDYTSITEIVDIFKDAESTSKYVQNVDYIRTGDSVNWSDAIKNGGTRPEQGNSYYVTFRYNKSMSLSSDVELQNGYDSSEGVYKSVVAWINTTTFPVNGTSLLIDYEYYLARKDLIVLDSDGIYTIYKGTPNIPRLIESPINQDEGKLVIGTVTINPGYSSADCDDFLKSVSLNTNDSTRLSQLNLQNLKKRVDNIEYDIAMTDLDEEAADGESATMLRGIYTDGFIGVSKCNTSHSQFHCCIDTDNSELTLPYTSGINKVKPNLSSRETTVVSIGSIYMAPYREIAAVSQVLATDSMLINPYAVYNNLALLKLDPAVDNWIEGSNITVEKTNTSATTLRRWWYHRGEAWAESERQKWLQITGTTGEQLGWSAFSGQTVTTTSATILDEAIMYMRQIEVNITGSNFIPNTDNLIGYFNDTKVSLIPTGSTQAGAESGTIRADARGRFTCKFTIPANVPCGSVSVIVANATNRGSAVYMAQGRKQIIQNTVLTTKITVNPYDPLAQSFQFDSDTILTKVDLFFASKDSNKNMVVQVRNMVNGYPGTTIYDEVVVESDNIATSSNGTVATTVKFSQPVYCDANTSYCLCLLSDSNEYAMWIATLGKPDVYTRTYVTSQPYVAGVLFSSSNAQTWTAHQESDLKFILYKTQYTGETGTIVFDEIETDDMNRVLLAAQSLDKLNSGVKWFYKYKPKENSSSSEEMEWTPIETYVDRELDKAANRVMIKVDIVPTTDISPMLAGDVVNLISFIEESEGSYISRTVFLDNSYNTVVVSYEAAIPTYTTVTAKFTNGDAAKSSTQWIDLTNVSSAQSSIPGSQLSISDPIQVDEDFSRYQFKFTFPEGYNSAENNKKYTIRIDMTSSSPVKRPRIRKLMSIMRNE